MNKIFKVKRNSQGQSVVCSEMAKSHSRGKVIAASLALAMASSASAVEISEVNGLQAALDRKANQSDMQMLAGAVIPSMQRDIQNKANASTVTALQTAVDGKADQSALTALQNTVASKADASALDAKADKADLDAKADKADLASKADASALDAKADKSELAGKADASTVTALQSAQAATNRELQVLADNVLPNLQTQINGKADASALDAKADKADLDAKADKADLDAKADKADLASKADASTVTALENTVAGKADQSDLNATNQAVAALQTTVDGKADKADLASKADVSDLTAVESKIEATNQAVVALQSAKTTTERELQNITDTVLPDLQNQINGTQVAVDAKADQSALDATNQTVANLQTAVVGVDARVTQTEGQVSAMATQLSGFNGRIGALEQNYQAINDRVTKMDKDLSAGVAGAVALAMMPTPDAGSHYITGGTGSYNGQQAVSLGMTGTSQSGKFSYKIGGSMTSSGSGVIGAGAGYRWK